MPNEYLWYRTKIKCQEWDNKALQERLLLHFGAVDQSCKIWMNGHFVVSHVGGYLPFSCDISEYVHSGENELVIMVQDLSDTSYHAKGNKIENTWRECIILLKVEYGRLCGWNMFRKTG